MNQLDHRLAKELSDIFPHLRTWAMKFETREYDADSLATDTVISFLERPETYNPARGPLKNFLFSFLKNKAVDFRKGYNRAYRKDFRANLKHRVVLFVMPNHDTDLVQDELQHKIERELETMPRRVAEFFRLFAFDGKGYKEIAQITGTSINNAKTMIYRARILLREKFSA